MAWFDGFRLQKEIEGGAVPYLNTGLVSTNTPLHNLAHIVLPDILGNESWLPVTRAEAMTIPAIAKARHLICGQIARLPLKALKDGTPIANQPTWLSRTDTGLSPQLRMMWIIDDLIFYGASLLVVERNAQGSITDAARVDPSNWSIDPDSGSILINGERVDKDSVVYIPGPFEGLLTIGARTIRGARDMEETKAARLRNPSPTTQIKLTKEFNLEPEELDAVRDEWIKARASSNGSVAVVPEGIDIINDANISTDLFIEASNAIAVQISQFLNVPAALMEASVAAGASLNYQNMATARSHWIDTGLTFWLSPIEWEFSRDYITPRGTYMQFDLSNLLEVPTPNTGPTLED